MVILNIGISQHPYTIYSQYCAATCRRMSCKEFIMSDSDVLFDLHLQKH